MKNTSTLLFVVLLAGIMYYFRNQLHALATGGGVAYSSRGANYYVPPSFGVGSPTTGYAAGTNPVVVVPPGGWPNNVADIFGGAGVPATEYIPISFQDLGVL